LIEAVRTNPTERKRCKLEPHCEKILASESRESREKLTTEEGRRVKKKSECFITYYPSSRLDQVQEQVKSTVKEEEAVKEPLRSCGRGNNAIERTDRKKKEEEGKRRRLIPLFATTYYRRVD
jgi:hypothetical protein